MRSRALLACALLGMVATPRPSHAFDELAARERIGARTGGLLTTGDLHKAYGDGWQVTLFFHEKVASWFLVDFRLGALYLGALKYKTLDDLLTSRAGITSSMRILYFSAGPMFGWPLGGSWSMHAGGGVGVYSVSIVFDAPTTGYNFSDQDIGFSGSAGVESRLGEKWCVDASATAHYVMITKNINDVYYAFTNGGGSPVILDIAVGVTLDLR